MPTPSRVEELSRIAADNIVDGMITQDLEDFHASCLHFSLTFQPLFPEFDSERILKATEAYVTALFSQSKLKDDKSLSRDELLHHERWAFVRGELLRMCELLNIPSSYAIETVEWFRYHAIRDDVYVKHLLEAHRVFVRRLTGRDGFHRELAGLYLAAIALHDRHDKEGVVRGREIMRTYYSILFHAQTGLRKSAN
jgi:hypothetical protein